MDVRRTALIVVALALSGCGSGNGDEGASSTAAASKALEVSEVDFKLEPSSLTVDAEGAVTIHAVNNGQTDHALEIEGPGVEEETETISPGASAELTVDLKPGRYELYCPIGDHRERGMEGTLVVGDAGGAPPATTTDESGSSGYGYG
jgi:uncharacterized cupredoxin-like copper-binding protein